MKTLKLTNVDIAVLSLLRKALFDSPLDVELFLTLSNNDWQSIFRHSVKQGVSAIIFDAILSSSVATLIPKPLILKWMTRVVSIESRHAHQKEIGAKVAELLAMENISVFILKGLAIASYYPRPEHRECGDIDIYSGEEHLMADAVLLRAGGIVKNDYYVHSHISFEGEVIENHHFFNNVRGSRSRKKLERHFIEMTNVKYSECLVPGTKLIMPSADFNALFLTMHALRHFILEGGIRLRHLADWAMFLNAEQDKVNWDEFFLWADKMHFSRFANAMTAVAIKYLGLNVNVKRLSSNSKYADMVLEDMLHPADTFHYKEKNTLRMRMDLVCGVFHSLWKFHKVYQKSAFLYVMGMGLGMLCEKTPKV